MFKQGDTVKIVSCKVNPQYVGKIGKVESVLGTDDNALIRVSYKDKMIPGYATEDCLEKMDMKVTKTLDLVLKKKWYDMIASGEKTEEYREIKPYWIVRMMEEVCHDTALFYEYNEHLLKNALYHGSMKFRDFDKVTFHLGYAKNRPSMTFAIKEIVIDEGKEEWGAFPGKTYFVVRLGKKLS